MFYRQYLCLTTQTTVPSINNIFLDEEYRVVIRGKINILESLNQLEGLIGNLEKKMGRELKDSEIKSILKLINKKN
jgi:hypothetical protein